MRYASSYWSGAVIACVFSTLASVPSNEGLWVARFSGKEPGGTPLDWSEHHFPRVSRHTSYELAVEDGRTVLKAESKSSASALVKNVGVYPSEASYLEWSWKIDEPVAGAVWGRKSADDFSARLFVIFEKSRGPFSFFGGIMTKVAGGLPGRALSYAWASDAEPGATAKSPYTGAVVMIAVESGSAKAGSWVTERRDVVADYQKAFGETPGQIMAIALMSDTDDTKATATAYYGDIHFIPTGAF